MLKIGGLWVSPVDMENAIMEHPLVEGVGVVGATVDDVNRIAAYVIRREGDQSDDELADELRAWCKQRLRRYEYPHVVRFVDDLPRTVNGKASASACGSSPAPEGPVRRGRRCAGRGTGS